MSSTAQLRYLRISPRKVRLVADLIRGLQVEEAMNLLRFTPKRAATPLRKLLASAVANADQKPGTDVDKLHVVTISVDQGPRLKRFRPRAMGRASAILKPTSHIKIVVEERE
jgi:large subunit ribosomal protein L22